MMLPEPVIDVSRWTALEWRQANLERPARGDRVQVRDVVPFGRGFLAVGWVEDRNEQPPARALIWLSDDGLDWRLVSDDSAAFRSMAPQGVTRARDAYIVWSWTTGSFLFSVDGINWTRTEHDGGGDQFVVTETSDGLFGLAIPFDGRAWTTTDGLTWDAHETTGLDLTATGPRPSPPKLVATDFGFLLAGEAVGSGLFDGRLRWASWFSPDGVAWQDFAFVKGATMAVGGRNAGWFLRGHRFVYAGERLESGVCMGWCETPHRRTADGLHWELAEPAFPDEGSFDGRFTLDFSGVSTTKVVRLSADGLTFLELEATGPESPPYKGWPSAVGSNGIVVFDNDSGPRPAVWFGRAVVKESPAVKPAVYCGSVEPATCLYFVGIVASLETPEGTAFVVSNACAPAWMDGRDSPCAVVKVPPGWPDSGALKRWRYDDGDLSTGSAAGWAEYIADRLQDGPWTDALVGDQLWVQFRHIDSNSIHAVMKDNGLSGPITVKPVGDVLWYAVGIRGRWPTAAKLATLQGDPRICAADFVRFDAALLKGEGEATPLTPPDASGCG